MAEIIVCTPKALPRDQWEAAADTAIAVNPMNRAPVERLSMTLPEFRVTRAHISVLTTKYWRTGGVRLTVGFLDGPSTELRKRILAHLNAWSKKANVEFVQTKTDPQVRIARTAGDGHWSYVGTDVLRIPKHLPTMNLDSFTMSTRESEFKRVIRHEAGHTLGCPHEHMRAQLVARLDEEKTIEYFRRTQGWNEQEVRQQVLTPLEEGSLIGTVQADPHSIMCYQIPGEITKDGLPIAGGPDITFLDHQFMAQIYPRVSQPKVVKIAPAWPRAAVNKAAKRPAKKASKRKTA